jgi:dihydroorotate dehydrogenase
LYAANLIESRDQITKKIEFLGYSLKNKVGLAAGLDKNGDYIDCLASLGFGFIEVGTVTPTAQKGNPKPRLFRVEGQKSLINRLGFNNKGVSHLVKNLEKSKTDSVIGVSIGKNANTVIHKAVEDYIFCLKEVYKLADYVAVNISSPNTRGLRRLESKKYFSNLLKELKKNQFKLSKSFGYKPLVIKISPDLNKIQLEDLASEIIDKEIDGLICSNTTVNHNYKEKGGLSGEGLFNLSTSNLSFLRNFMGKSFPIIASGGVINEETYKEKLKSGADLVQIYTGIIYEGPGLVHDLINLNQE